MRIYPAVILSSLALVTSLESAAAAAASTSSPTQSRATLDSGHEHRVRTSGRALRVHERVDKGEDERVGGVGPLGIELAEGIAKLNDEEASISRLFGEEETLKILKEEEESVLKHFGHEESLSPLSENEAWDNFDDVFLLRENPDLLNKIQDIKHGLANQRVMEVLTEFKPNWLLFELAGRYDDVSLSLALLWEENHAGAPTYIETLKDRQMKRLVETEMTPTNLVKRLEFGRENVGKKKVEEDDLANVREDFLEKKPIPYAFDCLDQFLKAYNEGKDASEQVTLLQALRASGTWESNKALLEYLWSRRYSSHIARDAYNALKAELKAEPSNVLDAVEEH